MVDPIGWTASRHSHTPYAFPVWLLEDSIYEEAGMQKKKGASLLVKVTHFMATVRQVHATFVPSRRHVLTTALTASSLVCVTALTAVASAHVGYTVEVNGVSRPYSAWATTVEEALNDAGIMLDPHDLVSPSRAEGIAEGATIVVRKAHPVALNINGEQRTVWTTATSLDDILSAADPQGVGAVIAASRSSLRGTLPALTSRPQNVTVTYQGAQRSVFMRPGDDIRSLLSSAGITVSPLDRVTVFSQAGALNVKVSTVSRGVVTVDTPVDFQERAEQSADLFVGESRVTTRGVPGVKRQTAWQETIDGTVVHQAVLAEEQIQAPHEQVRSTGTKEATPQALLAAGIDPKAQLEEGTEADGTTSVRYRAALGTISTPEEITALRVATELAGVPLVYSGEDPRNMAKQQLNERGWNDDEFRCLVALWQKESGWNPYAKNPSSGAYGIPQSLPGTKMATAGADWQTNPATQIRWGLGYIEGRYGTPCNAWGHSQSKGWY